MTWKHTRTRKCILYLKLSSTSNVLRCTCLRVWQNLRLQPSQCNGFAPPHHRCPECEKVPCLPAPETTGRLDLIAGQNASYKLSCKIHYLFWMRHGCFIPFESHHPSTRSTHVDYYYYVFSKCRFPTCVGCWGWWCSTCGRWWCRWCSRPELSNQGAAGYCMKYLFLSFFLTLSLPFLLSLSISFSLSLSLSLSLSFSLSLSLSFSFFLSFFLYFFLSFSIFNMQIYMEEYRACVAKTKRCLAVLPYSAWGPLHRHKEELHSNLKYHTPGQALWQYHFFVWLFHACVHAAPLNTISIAKIEAAASKK